LKEKGSVVDVDSVSVV